MKVEIIQQGKKRSIVRIFYTDTKEEGIYLVNNEIFNEVHVYGGDKQ